MSDTMTQDPTWGALEDAQHPRKLELLRRLLAGENAVDPAMTTIWGETPKPQPIYQDRPAEPQKPGAPKIDLTPLLEEQARERKKAPTIYDTPYGDRIRFLEAKARDAVWTRSKDAARYDLNRMQDLAERWISRTEGKEQGENLLAGKVLEASESDAVASRKERVQRILADMSRFKRGQTLDRGEEGVWQETLDQATGDSKWSEAPIPRKAATPKARTVPGHEAAGGAPSGQRVPAAVASAVTKAIFKNLDPKDPDSMVRAMVELRKLGIVPSTSAGQPGAPTSGGVAPGRTRTFRRGASGRLERVR
jgi:hypothetical protein